MTPKVIAVMIPAAMSTPSRMLGTALRIRMSSSAATSAPVHAPVPGSGMATKISSPSGPYFCTVSPLRCALLSIFATKPSSFGICRRIHANICRMNRIMNGTGSILPSTAAVSASG